MQWDLHLAYFCRICLPLWTSPIYWLQISRPPFHSFHKINTRNSRAAPTPDHTVCCAGRWRCKTSWMKRWRPGTSSEWMHCCAGLGQIPTPKHSLRQPLSWQQAGARVAAHRQQQHWRHQQLERVIRMVAG